MASALPVPGACDPTAPAWIGGYRLLDCIAEGGMGRLYRALDTTSCRMVAMKLPRAGTTAEVAGLLREGATLKRLHHPGIVQLLGEGTWDGLPWLALELLEGCTLLDRMNAIWDEAEGKTARTIPRRTSEGLPTVPTRLPVPIRLHRPQVDRNVGVAAGRLPEVVAIVVRLARALDHLHDCGLVHRDLKPANVFLGAAGAGGPRVTLLDFGLACRANSPRSAGRGDGLRVGTMQYAAPEQILGDLVDGRGDVYSLGCILYELVTGLRPFEGDSSNEIAQKHLHREPVAPSELVTGLPWQLEELIMAMLAKKPADRPPSAGAAATRLATITACQ